MKEVKDKLLKGEKLYIALAEWNSYSGSLVDGSTTLLVITPDSKPCFNCSIQENRELELIKEIKPLYRKSVTTYETSAGMHYSAEGYTVVVCDKPFQIWERHRGYTGDRNDRRDRVINAKELESIDTLIRAIETGEIQ